MRIAEAQFYRDYLKDESGLFGSAVQICFPESEDEVRTLLAEGMTLTPQGNRTGISGSCVPSAGSILNLSLLSGIYGMRQEEETFSLLVFAGTTMEMIECALEQKRIDTAGWDAESLAAYEAFKRSDSCFFAPAPTEKTATVGGIFALDAGGPLSSYYGSTKDWVSGVYLIDGCGRGRWTDDPDELRLLAGSEGMLGVFTRLKLLLAKKPSVQWGLLVFSQDEIILRKVFRSIVPSGRTQVHILAADIIDSDAMAHFHGYSSGNPGYSDLVQLPKGCCLYLEVAAEDDCSMERFLESVLSTAERAGIGDEQILAAQAPDEIRRFRRLRHGVTEALLACGGDTMLLDLQPETEHSDSFLNNLCVIYHESSDFHGMILHLQTSICHVCVQREASCLQLIAGMLQEAGGSVGVENGIGKSKKCFLHLCGQNAVADKLYAHKRDYDPDGRLNPENMF